MAEKGVRGGGKKVRLRKTKKEVLTLEWAKPEGYCGDVVTLRGTTKDFPDKSPLKIEIQNKSDSKTQLTVTAEISGNKFALPWTVRDILPVKTKGNYDADMTLSAVALGKQSASTFLIKFLPNVTKKDYSVARSHFSLRAENYVARIEGNLEYVKGWGGSVVKLGNSVPVGTGGVIVGFTWAGYRWMKKVGVRSKYWDGAAWVNLPGGFVLRDANNFCVGFYKSGANYTCQYGGNWPEAFSDWNIEAAGKQKKITKWQNTINKTWTGKFRLKRVGCVSSNRVCCRYNTETKAAFVKKAVFSAGMLIIADGNIRSNDSLFFLEEKRIKMAAHEFGHHIGNPDEYAGAAIDATLNGDGAVNGIDKNSIMGEKLSTVKKRHYRTVCKHFADMVKQEFGKTYVYEAVKK